MSTVSPVNATIRVSFCWWLMPALILLSLTLPLWALFAEPGAMVKRLVLRGIVVK